MSSGRVGQVFFQHSQTEAILHAFAPSFATVQKRQKKVFALFPAAQVSSLLFISGKKSKSQLGAGVAEGGAASLTDQFPSREPVVCELHLPAWIEHVIN